MMHVYLKNFSQRHLYTLPSNDYQHLLEPRERDPTGTRYVACFLIHE
jgi:hypothetical protein